MAANAQMLGYEQLVRQAKALKAMMSRVPPELHQSALQVALASLPQFTVNLPIAPNILTDMLLAANRSRGLGSLGAFKASMTIPPGTALVPGKATLSLPNPTGKTILFISGINIIASYYSTGVVLLVTADTQNLTLPYGASNEYTVTGPDIFEATRYTYVGSNATVVGYNATGAPSTVTFGLSNFTTDNATFEDYWLNLIDLGTDLTKLVAASR